MIKPPDKIYLQIEDRDYIDGATWCTDKINDTDIEYQRSTWISVEDRLPNEGEGVLVYIADRGSVMLTEYMGDFALARAGIDGFEHHGVTHWMPLPDPPE